MPLAPVTGRSVAAMMLRGLSATESHLIVSASGNGHGGREEGSPLRR